MATTTSVTHTPGPWFVDIERGYPMPIEDKDGIWICQIGDSRARCTDDPIEAEANARLIAAAPDMLAALKEVQHAIDRTACEADAARAVLECCHMWRAAIAKAEGR